MLDFQWTMFDDTEGQQQTWHQKGQKCLLWIDVKKWQWEIHSFHRGYDGKKQMGFSIALLYVVWGSIKKNRTAITSHPQTSRLTIRIMTSSQKLWFSNPQLMTAPSPRDVFTPAPATNLSGMWDKLSKEEAAAWLQPRFWMLTFWVVWQGYHFRANSWLFWGWFKASLRV